MLARHAEPRRIAHDLVPLVTRWVVTVAVGALLVAGCSGSSNDDDTTVATTVSETDEPPAGTTEPPAAEVDTGRSPGEVTLIDAGSEPRVALQITTNAQSRIAVDASEALDTTINGVTTSDANEAIYELDIDIQVGADGIEMLVVPTIVSIDGPMAAPDELGSWRWSLDRHGVVQRVVPIGQDEFVDEDVLRLLNVSNLLLATPTEPVGPGASWGQSLNRQSDAQLVFTLIGVTDTDLEIAVELVAPFDTGTATMVVSGIYDRATLLARDVTADSSLEITSPVTDNGELVELTGVQRNRRTYTEATE